MYSRVQEEEGSFVLSAASKSRPLVRSRQSRDVRLYASSGVHDVEARVEEAFWNGLREGRNDRALFLIAPDGLIVRSNSLANGLIAKGEFISVIRGHLVCNDPGEHQRFRSILEKCGSGEVSGGALRLDGQLVMTLDSLAPSLGGGLLLVVVYEASEFKDETLELWRDLFKLSPAEARVAEFMRRGIDDTTIANLLDITIHTVRSYVKIVHMKTDTNTRAALAHLLSRIDVFRG